VELAAKQEAIKEQVRKFDKFLKDNDAKRVRANRKAQEEVKLREQKEAERQLLAQELEKQRQKRFQMQEELERMAIFEQYLEYVCDSTEYFEDIENILKRYETLEAAQNDLRFRVDTAQHQAEERSAELASRVKSLQTESLVYNSQIATQQKRVESMRVEAQDSENDLRKKESDNKEGCRQLGEISMAIHNIYLRCHVRGVGPEACEDRLPLYLDVIQQRVCDLQAITKPYEHSGRLNPPPSQGRPIAEPMVGRVAREVNQPGETAAARSTPGGSAQLGSGFMGSGTIPTGQRSTSMMAMA